MNTLSPLIPQHLPKNPLTPLILPSIPIIIYLSLTFQSPIPLSSLLPLLHHLFIIIPIFTFFTLQLHLTFIPPLLTILPY
ncbi:hypothetical protein, partial [Staphylococcus epidermidis]|uniref:hypothetical protein n=1 Tax=Staphylococcus epidermidis TaxID=1282 RepID=UPI0037D9F3F7